MFRLLCKVEYKAVIDSEFNKEHLLANCQPFDLLFNNSQEAAEWMANFMASVNNNETYGFYYINVLNWQREEL